MSTKYIIALNANPNLCLGVTKASPNAPVVLSILQGAGSSLTQWYLDPNTGTISLVGSPEGTTLCLDIEGMSPANETGLIVSTPVLGRTFQSWNWVGNPPYVMNTGAPTYCVDDTGNPQPGIQAYIFTQGNGNINQQWQFLAVPVVEEALAASNR